MAKYKMTNYFLPEFKEISDELGSIAQAEEYFLKNFEVESIGCNIVQITDIKECGPDFILMSVIAPESLIKSFKEKYGFIPEQFEIYSEEY